MTTLAAGRSRLTLRAPGRAFRALARRALRDARARTLGFAYLFAAVGYLQPVAYRHAYPTLAERLGFERSFAHNQAVVLFYGKAYDLLTVGGYSAWRVGGLLTVFAAVFGVLAAVRALRAEEDAGRAELVLAGALGRGTVFAASVTAITAESLILGVAVLAGLVAGGLPVGGSAYLALAIISVAPVFAGVGALTSQLAPTRRTAVELGAAVVGISFLLRVIADTSGGAGWLRWLTPLGWAEEMRAFTGAQPLVLLAPLATGGVLLWAAARIAARRDLGSGLLAARDRRAPRLGLLSSPTAHALRDERAGLLVWMGTVGALAFVIGVISKTVTSIGISRQLRYALARLGEGSILSPRGYIGFSFTFFVLAVSLLAVSHVAAARHEEGEERLETLLALPISRGRWLGGRLVLAIGAIAMVSVTAGILAWCGAVTQGIDLSLPRMLEAGVNCLPVAIVFLGIAALLYAVVPRASTGIAYALVVLGFLWQLVGSLLGAPRWLVDATPFAHIGPVPAQDIRGGAAAIMVAAGLLLCAGAVASFRRRDLIAA
jgi:ABC-2 type transport system permease protein